MQRLILGLVMSLVGGQPGTTPAATPAPQTAARPPLKAPVAPQEAARARAGLKHSQEPGENGEVRHRVTFADGTVVEFPDRPKRPRDQAQRERVVGYMGTEAASREPDASFEAAGKASGLSPDAIKALRFVSRHEGGFDAINTWDRARFSWGFIQFAGGRGFPPALLHVKERSPELFQKLFADYGVDVMRDAAGRAEPVYVDSVSGQTLRGAAAEQAYGDHPTLIALFIRAGRVPEVKQRQIEAAIRDYAAPALVAAHPRVRLTEVLRSPQALAMLIDRQVHEGNVGRLEWALEHASLVNNMADPKDWPRLEAQVLDLTVQDSEARTIIAEQVEVAAAGMERAAAAARAGEAQFVSDGPTLAGAREALQYALNEAYLRLVVGERRDRLVHGLTATMTGTQAEQVRTGTPEMMAAHLDTLAANARELVSRMRFEYAIRNRLKGIRGSELPGPQR